MASWREFAIVEPEMAAYGRKLIWQYGLGPAFIEYCGQWPPAYRPWREKA